MTVLKSLNPVTIKFTLSSAPTTAVTLRIGTTLSFSNGRPQAKINNFSGPSPSAPTKIDSRGFTRGAYRGNGEVYDVAIPTGVLVAGTNTVVIECISGNAADGFLGPSFVSESCSLRLWVQGC